jgi:adenosylcobinamide-phosphate synthase
MALLFASALLLALAVDRILGEPAERWHPVVWMGRYLDWAGQRFAPTKKVAGDQFQPFAIGALYWTAGAAAVMLASFGLQYAVMKLPYLFAAVLLGLALKPLLALAMLCNEVISVERALQESLEAGRYRLGRLVSRETAQLSETQVRESAIESLAENFNDSVIAPIFWFVLLGLPGAALYRFANTADAMWGYSDMRAERYWQWAGKWAARADDVLSWIPARLSAALIWLCAGAKLKHGSALAAQAARTPSPNSGWPMAAMALALNVRLSKLGVYVLNEAGDAPKSPAVRKAVGLVKSAAWLGALFACIAIAGLHL